jgi:ribosomal protein L14
MLIKESNIYFQDNSGAVKVKIFFKGKKKYINELNIVRGSVKTAWPDMGSLLGKKLRLVETHSKVKVLMISTKKEKNRKNGIYLKFPESRGIIINDEKKHAKTVATYIEGFYPKELKKNQHFKKFTKKEKSSRQKSLMNTFFFPI